LFQDLLPSSLSSWAERSEAWRSPPFLSLSLPFLFLFVILPWTYFRISFLLLYHRERNKVKRDDLRAVIPSVARNPLLYFFCLSELQNLTAIIIRFEKFLSKGRLT
jgi:hypothetical protein